MAGVCYSMYMLDYMDTYEAASDIGQEISLKMCPCFYITLAYGISGFLLVAMFLTCWINYKKIMERKS